MKRLHAIVPLAALLAGIIAAPVDARTVSYPLENACPVIANRPDHDPSAHEQIAHTRPDAQLLVVRTAGHAMMYQYPHALATAIDRFIAQSQARPRQTAKAAQLHEQA
ncbi:hypothetical protein K788_0005504 [Paraburkholderia caribensis MBA4]|uniref:Alpha/beta hydrolase n=1 Tax=Paraburkholderia caribensis MBA4 TaxID=1323664 RepID=A0A0P0RFH8_9BURK|nr:hypothetical protein [Paraburkholderia caribensis]ALL67326.1 hypothetical protein K788_0005504 [Paraburkholderia caribensis MBA4]